MKRLSGAFSIVIVLLFLLSCGERSQEVAVLETDEGIIVLGFFEETAPKHAENFKVLSRSGFYEGTCFQRIVPGEFIQGGDPNIKDDDPWNDGVGGPGYTLEAELSDLKHRRGTVSMARGKSIDSSGSQFFVCLTDLPHLDGLFTIFGEVLEGMDVVDRIGLLPVDSSGLPVEKVFLKRVTIERRPEEDR
jgi:cyclophilin family peptidyl-prolyl cis-trans isomerase